MRIKAQEVEGDPALLDRLIPADFLVREGVPAARLVPQVEAILRRDLHLAARLSLTTAFRDVIVVKGRYCYFNKSEELKAAPENMTTDGVPIAVTAGPLGGKGNTKLDRYSTGVNDPDLLSDLGRFPGRRVVDEAQKKPNARFGCWIVDFWAGQALSPEERFQTLKNLTEQPGLTFAEEARGIRVLRVDRGE